MAIPVILRGETAKPITLRLADGYDYAGCTLAVDFCGVVRSFGGLAPGGTLPLTFTDGETAGFPLGTSKAFLTLTNAAGDTCRLPWAKIKVTDSPDELRDAAASIDVDPATFVGEILPARFTDEDVRSRLNAIINWMKRGAVGMLLALALPGIADVLTVQTAPKGTIYNDEQVVTNVTLDASGLATKGEVPGTVSNIVTKTYVEELGIAGGGAEVGNYANVSNRAMNAVQKGEDLEMIGDGEEYGYKLGPGGGYPWDGSGWSIYESFFFPLDYINSGGSWNWYQIFSDQDDPDKYAATLVRQADLHIAKNEVYDNIDSRGYLTNETDPSVPSWAKSVNPPTETDPTVPAWAKSENPPVMSLEPATNYAAEVAQAATNYTDTANAETRAIVATWEAYIGGTNVVFAITNYISGSYPLDDGKLKIHELRDGAYRELYDSHTDITNHLAEFKANDMVPALSALSNSVETALADVPDKAWGRYTSAGEENEMTNAVWISHPETVFGGGTEWKRVAVGEGSVCFLTTSGNQVYTAGEEGKFYFSDWGYTNKFGFATTASFTIGIDPDSIQVDSSQIVAIGFDVTMTGVPVIWYAPAIEGAPVWEQLNNPDGSPVAGASHVVSFDTQTTPGWIYAFVNCANEDRGFFRAAIEQEGGASLFSTMPIDPQGGILCTNGINKVGIDWNNGQPRLVPWRN